MWKHSVLLPISFALVSCGGSQSQSIQPVNHTEFKGDYAFTFNGMTTGGGGASTPFAAVGRFTADGAGNLTDGQLDTNGVGPLEKLTAQAFTGTYSIGADNRGTMNLNIPGGGVLAFAILSNGNAKFVEVDASGNHGTVGSGTMEKVNTAAYNTASITGDYAFGISGLDQSNNRSAIAGRFTANGVGTLSNGAADENMSGIFSTNNLLAGTYLVTDTTTGRGVVNLGPVIGGSLQNLNFVFYVVNASKIFMMESDVISPVTPLLLGPVLQQQTPLGVFSNASLNGGMVTYFTGKAVTGGGLITADGIGGLTVTLNGNATYSGTYVVASNGRTDIRFLTDYVAAYLVSANEAFLIAPDSFGGSTATSGFGEPQAAGRFTNSSVHGTYVGYTLNPASLNQTILSGVFTADGASPNGTLAGTEDVSAASGARLGVAATATYSGISSFPAAAPANGRGSISGNFGAAGDFPPDPFNFPGVIYVISSSKFIVVSSGNISGSGPVVDPVLLIFEQ